MTAIPLSLPPSFLPFPRNLNPRLAVACGIITTAAYVAVKAALVDAISRPLYVLYGYGFGLNIVSWCLGVFTVLLLGWSIVDEYPHYLSPYLPPVAHPGSASAAAHGTFNPYSPERSPKTLPLDTELEAAAVNA